MAGVNLRAATRPGATLTRLHGSSFSDSYFLNSAALEIVVVSSLCELDPALQRLREAAEAAAAAGSGCTYIQLTDPPRHSKTPLIAIDLEWRPDFRPGSNNPVALVQLAADGLCMLAALAAWGARCRLSFVGLNWSVSDERKMRSSFGRETSDFGNYVDLATLAARSTATYGLGGRPGLAALAERVQGLAIPKNKQITLSDWAAPSLSPEQIKYATLDATLVWHLACRLG